MTPYQPEGHRLSFHSASVVLQGLQVDLQGVWGHDGEVSFFQNLCMGALLNAMGKSSMLPEGAATARNL